jgi:hypothetical protein
MVHKKEIQNIYIWWLLVNCKHAGTAGVTNPWNFHFFYHFFMGLLFTSLFDLQRVTRIKYINKGHVSSSSTVCDFNTLQTRQSLHPIWPASQLLILTSGHLGVDDMIAINNQLKKLSMSIKVLQASRLKALNVLKLSREISNPQNV